MGVGEGTPFTEALQQSRIVLLCVCFGFTKQALVTCPLPRVVISQLVNLHENCSGKVFVFGDEHSPCDPQEEVFLQVDVSTGQPTMRANRPRTHSEVVLLAYFLSRGLGFLVSKGFCFSDVFLHRNLRVFASTVRRQMPFSLWWSLALIASCLRLSELS